MRRARARGGRFLLALFARLVATGYSSALVWVVRANPARYFYERIGGKQVMYRPIPVGGQPVEAVAYGWRDLASVLGRHAAAATVSPATAAVAAGFRQ